MTSPSRIPAALLALVASLALAASGCGGDDEEGDDGSGVSADAFETELPAGWEEGDEEDRENAQEIALGGVESTLGVDPEQIMFEVQAVWTDGDSEGDFVTNVNVIAEPLPPGLAAEQYVDLSTDLLEQTGQFENVTTEPGPDVDGSDSTAVEYTASQGDETVQLQTLILVRDETGYNITMTAAEDQFDEATADLDEILASWSWD